MRSSDGWRWGALHGGLNSILARTLAMVIAAVLLISATTAVIVSFLLPPRLAGPISTYEVARQLRNLPIAAAGPELSLSRGTDLPAVSDDAAARLITEALAARLGRQPADIRLFLRGGRQRPIEALEAQRRYYGPDGGFDPLIYGRFTAALRQPDGSWLTLARGNRVDDWRDSTFFFLSIWIVVFLPIAWWFARRLSRPIRDFSLAVRRVGGGDQFLPVPISGPTEIRLAAESLNDMQARLARYIAERTSVVGAIAHDLRAPLSRLNFHMASAPAQLRNDVEAELREMEQMIMVTLEFVEHETRPLRRDPVELALLVEGVVDNFADMGRDVHMRQADCAMVSGDQLMLKRLFANLVDNAVKYGGSATVDVQREAEYAVVDVEDGGTGMKPADIERAFEPFYRVEPSRSRRTGGVGLGLSIVRSVALTHGGSVELANVEGGLRARVRLPLIASAMA